MKILLASDHAGYEYKKYLEEHLKELGYEPVDIGCYSTESVDYPLFAFKLGQEVVKENCLGVGICGTGIGMAMAANKIDGIRAAVVDSISTAILCREHNDANIVCLGSRIVAKELALQIVETFLKTPFLGGRHERRVELLTNAKNYINK